MKAQIIDFYNSCPQGNLLLPAILILLFGIMSIVLMFLYIRKRKALRERNNLYDRLIVEYSCKNNDWNTECEKHKKTIEDCITASTHYQKSLEELKGELAELKKEYERANDYLIKVNKSICTKRNAIIDELLTDATLRESAMKHARLMIEQRIGGLCDGDITNFFDEIYKCLKVA